MILDLVKHYGLYIILVGLVVGIILCSRSQDTKISKFKSQVSELQRELRLKTLNEKSHKTNRVTITRQADGTTVEQRETTEDTSKDLSESTDKVSKRDATHESLEQSIKNRKPQYQLGVYYPAVLDLDYRRIGANIGSRLGELPLFIIVGGEPWEKNYHLGIQVEF